MVADFDRGRGTVTVVVQALGKTTREMRDGYAEGDHFGDFVGPLGLPQHIANVGHVVLVGGGLGVAPVFPQLRAFKQAGNRTTCIVGFRTHELAFWRDELAAWSATVILAMSAGRRAARAIATYLNQGRACWPPSGAEVAAFAPPKPLAPFVPEAAP